MAIGDMKWAKFRLKGLIQRFLKCPYYKPVISKSFFTTCNLVYPSILWEIYICILISY